MPARSVGEALRDWRQRRRMSQLDLALEAEISQRHLSFLESGRSRPSREMLLHLAERLEVPLRERNPMLLAAGYAPVYAERALDDPAMKPAREAIELVLRGHEPFPALAVDRHWTLVSANAALGPLLAEVRDAALLRPPVNVLRLALHPEGLAPAIANLPEWRAHLLERLRHQIAVSGDGVLSDLMRELAAYPAPAMPAPRPALPAARPAVPAARSAAPARDYAGVLVPLELVTRAGPLSFFSTTTVFGTQIDVTLSELALECFFPANAETAVRLRALAAPNRLS